MSGKLRIGLLWHSANSGNLGVGALTFANISLLEAAAASVGLEAEFTIIGWKDPWPVYDGLQENNISIVGLRTRDFAPFGRFSDLLKSLDIVFDIGAGDSFADIYGTGRFLKIWAPKALCIASATPLVLSPQTMGPFKNGWVRLLAGWAVKRAAAVFTRDGLSTQFLRDIGFGGSINETTDVAMKLPLRRSTDKMTDQTVDVGINVSGLLMNGGYTQDNMFALRVDFPVFIDRVVAHFASLESCRVHLISHVNAPEQPVEDDFAACERLVSKYPSTVLVPRFTSPVEAKSYISSLDFFMGARMHACIAAVSSGVVTAPLAYSRKFEGLFGSLGYDATIDMRSLTTDEAFSALLDVFEKRSQLKETINSANARASSLLNQYKDVASSLMKTVAEARPLS
ncbi:MAG: polysaccharide pyruvyl transferase family protein [Pseudomonadota bacterium]